MTETDINELPPRAQVGHALKHTVREPVESKDDLSVGSIMGRMTMRGYPMLAADSDLTYPEIHDTIEEVRDMWLERGMFADSDTASD